MLYAALSLLALLSSVASQQMLEVPMRSNGRDFSIRFSSTDSLAKVTREFCIRNAEALGILPLTEASLPGCQEPVAKHIRDHVERVMAREPAQEELSVELTVGQNKYNVRFQPTAESLQAVSRDFCIRNADSLNIQPLTEESLPNCQQPVLEYLKAEAIKHLQARQQQQQQQQQSQPQQQQQKQPQQQQQQALTPVRTTLNIAGQQVQFEVLPTEESILSQSRAFCINNQQALGIAPLTEQSLPGCQQPLVDALVKAVRDDAAAKQMVEVKLNVSGNDYLVRFRPAVEPVQQVARDFCITNMDSLGLPRLTEESLPHCQQPVAEYLMSQLRSIQ